MLTVEIDSPDMEVSDVAEVHINFDGDGPELLITSLSRLARHANRGEHTHLMTPSWAGDELDEVPVATKTYLVNHLRLAIHPKQNS